MEAPAPELGLVKKVKVAGLSAAEVDRARTTYGSNDLPAAEVDSFWDKLQENFDDPLIRILVLALAVTMVLAGLGYADYREGIGIAVAVFLATFVATYSEFKNEASFQELQEKASRIKCMVFRSGELVEVEIADVVVGDSVLLQAGNRVPADGFIVDGAVEVVQASLTGESDPITKKTVPEGYTPDGTPTDELMAGNHHAFRGSLVDSGEAIMLVSHVGVETVFGKLSVEISSIEEREAPLTIKLAALADGVANVGYIGATFIAVSFLFKQFVMDNGYSLSATIAYASNWQIALHDVVTSIILAIIVVVVAVPEGLPMMIAIVLSLNMRKLLADQVLVRRLLGIETAGCMNMLFSDKTGTITYGVFQPKLLISGSASFETFAQVPEGLSEVLALALRESSSAIVSSNGEDIVGGNSSDRALLRFLSRNALLDYSGFRVEREDAILFSSVHKFSAAQIAFSEDDADGLLTSSLGPLSSSGAFFDPAPASAAAGAFAAISLYKGAAELVLSKCSSYHDENTGAVVPLKRRAISSVLSSVDELSARGYRFIAVATSSSPLAAARVEKPSGGSSLELPGDLTLVGVIGMTDEIRPESPEAMRVAEEGGIHVIMVTGDRAETAAAIAQQVGLLPPGEGLESVLTSSDMARMSDDELAARLPTLRVVARALPTDKSRLVALGQRGSGVVGMTGDGANDTSALKAADVSFAIGDGAEIAKEASDIVILDSNFASIIRAALYGRTIFKSIRKFANYQSIINLLWINLIMDTLAALAFGGEPALPRYMREAPISRDTAIISPYMWSSILWNGIGIALYSIFFLTSDMVHDLFDRAYVSPYAPEAGFHDDGSAFNDDVAQVETSEELAHQGGTVFLTAFFCFFVFLCGWNALGVRTKRLNIFEGVTKNIGFVIVVPLIFIVQVVFTLFGGSFLRTVPLDSHEWWLLIAATFLVVPWDILRKILLRLVPGGKLKDD
ncbi:P-type ATPase [Thecamonas trahens ATCC 50062]|uniref:P-type ATPase n=1 Tax=Thecamonas trahens ATCC 50062 TaxID=461836 RepID=A0A0L0DJA4_THETB|nr:P-type ATPase [Thecamonas trahens ATCC 50062]KNC51408.1 P-type ATPase [Thecamonas trahens ATCC 50062]|eukprot:XP_013756075.1 P-type ATPase [Thecamonas trahens ATCC 50062]